MHAEIERDADLGVGDRGAKDRHGHAVREQEVVVRGRGLTDVLDAGRVAARTVAEPRRAPRFVEGDPALDVVAERARDDVDVLARSARRCRARVQPPRSSRGWGRSQ